MPNLIAEASAWLDLKVGAGTMAGLTAPMRRLMAATLTAIICLMKDPSASSLGDYSEDRDAVLKKLNASLDEMIKDAGGGIGFRYSYESLPRSYIAVG